MPSKPPSPLVDHNALQADLQRAADLLFRLEGENSPAAKAVLIARRIHQDTRSRIAGGHNVLALLLQLRKGMDLDQVHDLLKEYARELEILLRTYVLKPEAPWLCPEETLWPLPEDLE